MAAVFNTLFSMDSEHPLKQELSLSSVKAAINFVEVCNDHTAIIGGRKNTTDPVACK